ncbi:MAG: pilus assembly protein [Rhizobiaceae bacterium]
MNISATIGGRTRLLVFSSDAETTRRLETIISSLALFDADIRDFSAFSRVGEKDLLKYDILVVDVDDGALLENSEFNAARVRIGKTPVVFLSRALAPEQMRVLMRLDGADWIPKPIEARPIVEALNSITNRLGSAKNIVHAVLPAGGGAGGTSVSIMLAYYLSRGRKREAPSSALFDLDFSTGLAGAYLNIENAYDLGGVREHPERVDLEFVNLVRKTHKTGFNLFSFESPDIAVSNKSAELVLRMLDVIALQHDYTVLDLPTTEAHWSDAVLRSVNTVTIVCNHNVPGLQRAKDLLRRLVELRGDKSGISIVVNRIRTGMFGRIIGKKEILKVFQELPTTMLPNETDVFVESLNRGVLPVEVHSRSKSCKRLSILADAVREGVTV